MPDSVLPGLSFGHQKCSHNKGVKIRKAELASEAKQCVSSIFWAPIAPMTLGHVYFQGSLQDIRSHIWLDCMLNFF